MCANDRLAGNSYTNESIYGSIFQQPPTMIGPTTEDGRVTTMETLSVPTYGILNRSGYTKYTGMYASTYAGVTVDLDFVTRGLSVTANLAFQSSNDRYNYMTQDFSRYYYDYTKGDFVQLGSNLNTNLTGGASGMFQYAISYIAQLDYKRSFGKHAAEAHLYTYFTNEQLDDVNADYPAVGFPHDDHNTGLNLSYAYDDRYVVGATFGLTASDVFSRSNRYTFVPSFSAAWVASNEAFLRDVKWLSLLKVRASYGEVALDDFEVGNYRYMYEDYIKKNGDVRLLGNPDLEPRDPQDPELRPRSGAWNKLNLTFDYFSRRTDNMLIEGRCPDSGLSGHLCRQLPEGQRGQDEESRCRAGRLLCDGPRPGLGHPCRRELHPCEKRGDLYGRDALSRRRQRIQGLCLFLPGGRLPAGPAVRLSGRSQ